MNQKQNRMNIDETSKTDNAQPKESPMKLHRPRGTRDFTPKETEKWRCIENCFRYEHPQKGRFRELWQFGVELIGSDHAEAEEILKETPD